MAGLFCFLIAGLSLLWVQIVISPQVYRPLMLLLGVWATFRFKPTRGRWGPAIDTLWVIAGLLGLGWPLAIGEPFLYRSATPTGGDILCGVLAMLAVLEAARRTTGWILPITAAIFVAYAFAGPSLATIGLSGLAHRGYDLPRLIGNLYMTLEGMYGLPLDVAVTYIILFSIYGAVLEYSGAGRFFLDFSMAMSSRKNALSTPRGDAIKVGRSVTLAGFLLGTVSGSGVATTVTLGSVAWPLMRRAGFAAETAGAMLAASGIGALLSPPTLGAAAFLIAEYLRISYLQVLIMATIPTLLYYLSILLMIEADARRQTRLEGLGPEGLKQDLAIPPSSLQAFKSSSLVPRRYLHFSSLLVVAVLMFAGFTPFRAVFWSTIAAVAISFVASDLRASSGVDDERLTPRRLVKALVAGGEDVLPVLATTAVAGIIVGVVTLTGLGLKSAGLIVGLAGGSLTMTVVFSAIAVWVLGLAVPVTASYIISAVMVVPALTHVGVPDVAAHMFIFYYAVLSEVSPPTALASFAAAALTGGRPFRTMMLTWKYALPAFLVPFAFTLDPRGLGLLLQAHWVDVLRTTATAGVGIAALAMACGGWAIRRTSLLERVLAAAGGLLLFHPAPMADISGLSCAAAALALNWRR